jgi:hypothetical protein
MNEWKGVLVFNKEMVQNMPSYKCMHVKERKEGRKGEGLWLSLGCGLHGHQCPN